METGRVVVSVFTYVIPRYKHILFPLFDKRLNGKRSCRFFLGIKDNFVLLLFYIKKHENMGGAKS